MNDAVTAHEITIRRVFDASRELVFRAWIEPDQLVNWYGPPNWTTPLETVVIDPRPGGEFRVTQFNDEGEKMTTVGVFREVVEPERLVIVEPGEGAWHEGAESVVTFTDLGDGRTEMVLRSTIHTTDQMRTFAEAGMRATFDRLAEHLAR